MGIKLNKVAAKVVATEVVKVAPIVAAKAEPKPAAPSFIKKGAAAKSVLSLVASADEDFVGKDLWLKAGDLHDRSELLLVERMGVLHQLSQLTCPYKVGDYLKLNRGLGAGGLIVEAIMVCEFPAFNNRWAIQTNGLAKDGTVSRRTLLLSEWQLTNNNAGLSVLEHKKVSK